MEPEIGSAPTSPNRAATFHTRGASVSSIAEDVIGKRVPFGRFAANWLSRKTLGLPRPGAMTQDAPESPFDDALGLANAGAGAGATAAGDEKEGGANSPAVAESPKESGDEGAKSPDDRRSDQATELLPKLLKYTKLLFASRNFFFAYDYDLTRSFDAQGVRTEHLPLHKAVDPLVCF